MLVEQRAAVRDVRVDELQEAPEAPEPVLFQAARRKPLGSLQLRQEPERGLALEPLVEREEMARDDSLVHRAPFRAWLSSSKAFSTESAQSKARARCTSALRSHGVSRARAMA